MACENSTNITQEQVVKDLKGIIAETFKINTENVDGETRLFNGGLSLNSIQMIELTISIESFYKRDFRAELLVEDNFCSISVLSDVIIKNLF